MDEAAADGKAEMLANLATWVATTMPENGSSMLADFLSQADEATRKSAARKLNIANDDARTRAMRMLQTGSAVATEAVDPAVGTVVDSSEVDPAVATQAVVDSAVAAVVDSSEVDPAVPEQAVVDSATETDDSSAEDTETTPQTAPAAMTTESPREATETTPPTRAGTSQTVSAAMATESATEATDTTHKRHAWTLQAGASDRPPKKRLHKIIMPGEQEPGPSTGTCSNDLQLPVTEDNMEVVPTAGPSVAPSATSYSSVVQSELSLDTSAAAVSASPTEKTMAVISDSSESRTSSAIDFMAAFAKVSASSPSSSVLDSTGTSAVAVSVSPTEKTMAALAKVSASSPSSSVVNSTGTSTAAVSASPTEKTMAALAKVAASSPSSSVVNSTGTMGDCIASAPSSPVVHSVQADDTTTTQTICTTTDLLAGIKTMIQPLFDRVNALEALQTRENFSSTSTTQATEQQAAGTEKAGAASSTMTDTVDYGKDGQADVSSNDNSTMADSVETDDGVPAKITSHKKTAKAPSTDTTQGNPKSASQTQKNDPPASLDKRRRVDLGDHAEMVDDYVEDYLEYTPGAKILLVDILNDFRKRTRIRHTTYSDLKFFLALQKSIEEKGAAWDDVTKRNGRVGSGKGMLYDNMTFKKRTNAIQRGSLTRSSKSHTSNGQAAVTAKTTKTTTKSTPFAGPEKSAAASNTKPTKTGKGQIQLPDPLDDKGPEKSAATSNTKPTKKSKGQIQLPDALDDAGPEKSAAASNTKPTKTGKGQIQLPDALDDAGPEKSAVTSNTNPTKKTKGQIQLPVPLDDAVRYTRGSPFNPRNIYFPYLEHSADELKGRLVLAQYFSPKNATDAPKWYVGSIADVLPPKKSKTPPFDRDHAVRFEIAWGDEDPEGTMVTEHNILLIPSVLDYDLASDKFLPECVFFGSPEQVVVSWIEGCDLVMDLIDDLKEQRRDPKTFAGMGEVRRARRGQSINPPRLAKMVMMNEGAYNSAFSRDISQEDAREMARDAALERQLAEMMDAATSSDSGSD